MLSRRLPVRRIALGAGFRSFNIVALPGQPKGSASQAARQNDQSGVGWQLELAVPLRYFDLEGLNGHVANIFPAWSFQKPTAPRRSTAS